MPRTDVVLNDPRLRAAAERLGRAVVKAAVAAAQQRVRDGELGAAEVAEAVVAALPESAGGLRPVLNATGVVLHTNLGRAALSEAARAAVVAASGHTDVELDLRTGRRARRGRAALAALAGAVPEAGGVHVVNNGAAALVLAATALAGGGREIIVSRGEMVEIGDGFRLPDLLASTGARLREVGTTNRTSVKDYEEAINQDTGFILKVHPSNFVIRGFTSSVPVSALRAALDGSPAASTASESAAGRTSESAAAGQTRENAEQGPAPKAYRNVPVVVDIGSGLLRADPLLPDEPTAAAALRDGADLVTASGDKLLGGPQAGLLLGRDALIETLRRHPLARALRVDKLTLAALQATLDGPETPTWQALRYDPAELKRRTERAGESIGPAAEVVETEAVVGGGGAPEVTLASWALALPAAYAEILRGGTPPIVGRVERGRLLLDLRCVPADRDRELVEAVKKCTS